MVIGLNYIDGEFCPSHPDVFCGDICVPESTKEEVEDAIKAARRELPEWSGKFGEASHGVVIVIGTLEDMLFFLAQGNTIVWKPFLNQVKEANNFVKSGRLLHRWPGIYNIIYGSNRVEEFLRMQDVDHIHKSCCGAITSDGQGTTA